MGLSPFEGNRQPQTTNVSLLCQPFPYCHLRTLRVPIVTESFKQTNTAPELHLVQLDPTMYFLYIQNNWHQFAELSTFCKNIHSKKLHFDYVTNQ